jgi:hypothetical protein
MSLADDETVAYLHLHSFTLGSAPPLLKSIRSHPGGLTLELDYTNSDVSLVVALKLSSMDHVLLPTTLLEVADLQMNMPVKVGVQVDPDYPVSGGLGSGGEWGSERVIKARASAILRFEGSSRRSVEAPPPVKAPLLLRFSLTPPPLPSPLPSPPSSSRASTSRSPPAS